MCPGSKIWNPRFGIQFPLGSHFQQHIVMEVRIFTILGSSRSGCHGLHLQRSAIQRWLNRNTPCIRIKRFSSSIQKFGWRTTVRPLGHQQLKIEVKLTDTSNFLDFKREYTQTHIHFSLLGDCVVPITWKCSDSTLCGVLHMQNAYFQQIHSAKNLLSKMHVIIKLKHIKAKNHQQQQQPTEKKTNELEGKPHIKYVGIFSELYNINTKWLNYSHRCRQFTIFRRFSP